ncbi:hypothetical protein BH11ARM2_BH11ARM2_13590 [soil metagenome]
MSIDYPKRQDARRNNPTMENRKFFVREEEKPYDALYPRDARSALGSAISSPVKVVNQYAGCAGRQNDRVPWVQPKLENALFRKFFQNKADKGRFRLPIR